MGVGENNGKWLSIFQNSPTTNAKLDFNIKIKGDNLSGSCKYEGGSFISESGTNDSGCTLRYYHSLNHCLGIFFTYHLSLLNRSKSYPAMPPLSFTIRFSVDLDVQVTEPISSLAIAKPSPKPFLRRKRPLTRLPRPIHHDLVQCA